jgi:hypothetical protein
MKIFPASISTSILKLLTLPLIAAPAWSQQASITLKTGETISAWIENDVSSQTPRKIICFMFSGKKPVEIAWTLHGMTNVADEGKGTVLVKPLPRKQNLVTLRPIDKDKPMSIATLTLRIPEREY